MNTFHYKAKFIQIKSVKKSYTYYIRALYAVSGLSICVCLLLCMLGENMVACLSVTGTINLFGFLLMDKYLARHFGTEEIKIGNKIIIRKTGRVFNKKLAIKICDVKHISRICPDWYTRLFPGNYRMKLVTTRGAIFLGFNLPFHVVSLLMTDLNREFFSIIQPDEKK